MVLQLGRPEIEVVESIVGLARIDFEREYTLEEFFEDDVHRKIGMYREAGVKLLWNIYLLENFVIVYELDKPGSRRVLLEAQDELTGGDVLPGFKVSVAKLFE